MKPIYVVEKRTADGQLDFSLPQPPFKTANADQLCKHWMRLHPTGPVLSWLEIKEWYAAQGFKLREKTW